MNTNVLQAGIIVNDEDVYYEDTYYEDEVQSDASQFVSPSGKPLRSYVWKHFVRSRTRALVKCNICERKLKYVAGSCTGTTTPLRAHLRLRHQIIK